MTLRVQMRVLEPARIFQSKTKHPIKSNMSGPNQRQHQRQMLASVKSVAAQRQREDVSVDGVVGDRPDTSIEGVADHRDIRYEEEQSEQKPTAVIRLVGEEAGDEDGGTFEMEKWFGIHRLRS